MSSNTMIRLCSVTTMSIATFSSASFALAKEAPFKKHPNAIVADLGLHVVNLGYQRTLSPYIVAQMSAGLYGPWTVYNNVLGLGGGERPAPPEVIGFAVRGRAFVFPFGHAPGGLWVSPYLQGGVVGATREGRKVRGPAFATGLSVGYTFCFGNRVLLGLGIGGQYHRASFEGSSDVPGFSRIGPTVDINLGFRF